MVQKINGPALRAIREARDISCRSLARAAGVDVSFLARIERGEKHGIGGEAFARIVEVLGVDGRSIMANPFGVTAITATSRGHIGPTVVPSVCTTCTAA